MEELLVTVNTNGKMIKDSDSKAVAEEVKLMDVKDPEWRWPTHEKWYSHLEGTWKTKETTSSASGKVLRDGLKCPFEVTTLINETNEEEEVTVKLRSPYLIPILRKCLPVTVETLCCEEPNVDAKDLFIIWPDLQQELKALQVGVDAALANGGANKIEDLQGVRGGCQGGDDKDEALYDGKNTTNGPDEALLCECNREDEGLTHLHLQHLLRFLDEHFKEVSAKYSWMKQEGLVSYNMLWAFLSPGLEVRRICNLSGQTCHAVVHSKGKYAHRSWAPDENCFKIKLKVMDYNVESYRKCTMKYKIEEFDGEVPFASLAVCPWSFFSSQERCNMAEHLQQRGQLFSTYAMEKPFQFMHFRGSMGFYERNSQGCFQLRRVNADGRVMVDLLSLARANPDWPLGNAQPPSELLRGVVGKEIETAKQEKKPTQEELQWAPAAVFGFSFSLKKWGCFDVEGLKEITFDDQAYDQLVMKSTQQKKMLRAIVATHLLENGENGRGVDVVAQKGEGCVVLCYGPPGTGKTLTAETLAETLHRPLWAISAFELGEEAGQLEECLHQVLSTALRWRAVVLLDEADGYLERRTFNVDITRNLMTGVFLRLLEYYAGVLFLTTNRVRAFDEAFLSRISLSISYPPLDDHRRMLIWQSLLVRAGLAACATDADIMRLVQCGQPLNGREIRNIVALAHTWAHSREQPLGLNDVHDALQFVIAGSRELLKDLLESSTP